MTVPILILVALAAVGVAARRAPWISAAVYGGTGVVCGAAVLAAVLALAGRAPPQELLLPMGVPWIGLHLRLDALSAFFLLVVNFGGVTASLFGWGYERAHHGGHDAPPGPVLPLFPLFLAGMNLVLVAGDAFGFLVGWEAMSLASWLLVLSTHREPETPRAARLYLIMASFGAACLLLAFGLLAGPTGDYSFAAIRAHVPDDAEVALVVLLVLLGAGSKAGLVPLHVWLPLAHPAAPSHVSALMSGVMTKVAIYAMVRILFDLLGEPAWWWGGVMMAAGAVTAVMGVLYALMQDDVKRLLACSTIENIGAVVIALGLALVFKASHTPVIAALALSAGLLHVVNHSLFKTLLFYVAGAVLTATGTRDLNRLGGLIHRMPETAVLALVGASAISALPPLNGFVGEWLLFQAILNAPALPEWSLKIAIAVVGAAVALATALAAACFVRFYGTAFLGRPRSAEAGGAGEVGPAMRAGMAVPAVLCILLGVLPTPLLRLFEPAVRLMVEAGPFDDRAYQPWLWLSPTSAIGNSYNGLIMLVVIGLLSVLLVAAIHRRASDKLRRSIAWGCGFETPDPEGVAQYGASSFAQPIRRAFGGTVFHARDRVDMPEPGDLRPARLSVSWTDPAWALVFTPIGRTVDWLTQRVNGLQYMTIRRYLTLMFAALVLVLIVVAVTQR
ncbi:hydrogenase 4 subunit B (plasmid) [Azospirillum thermophilum]|uniref:Hydrogenase 4 subunit B n=2 Tax=Azospirillum thermophilum TaxID=2202148 RepID=A0A2S2CXR3_9PROT|nr:hydrogenase 4 subunit B [Azospirillum thermophilum]